MTSSPATISTRHPRLVLVVALIATLLSIALMFRFKPETSIEGLLDPTDPAVAAMGKVLTRFPVVEELLILATLPPDAPVDAAALTDFAERFRTRAMLLKSADGQPLVTAVRDRPDAQMFEFVQRVVVPNGLYYLDDAAYAEAMRRLERAGMDEQLARGRAMLAVPGPAAASLGKALLRDPLRLHEFLIDQLGRLNGSGMKFGGGAGPPGQQPFLSPDGRSLLIRVSGTRPPSDLAFCREIVDGVTGATRDANAGGLDVRIAGAYAVAAYNAAAIRHDAILGVNGSVVGILVLFAIFYRRPLRLFSFAFLPMAAGIAWGFGLFALVHPSFTPLAAVVGGALAGIGIDYFVFFLSHHSNGNAGDRIASTDRSVRRLRGALLTAWATSCVGFVAVAWSPVRVLRDFALLGTLALGGAYLASVFVLPAALALFDRAATHRGLARPIAFTRPLGRLVMRRPRGTLAVAAILVALAGAYVAFGPNSVAPSSSLLSLHPHPNPPIEAQRFIAERMQMSPGSVQIYFTATDARKLLALAHEIDRRVRSTAVTAAGSTGTFGLASVLPDPNLADARRVAIDPQLPARVATDLPAAAEAAGFNGVAFAPYVTFLQRLATPAAPPSIADVAAYPAVAQMVLPRGASDDSLPTDAMCLVFFDNPLDVRDRRDAAIEALRGALAGLDGVTVTGMASIGQRLESSVRRDLPVLVGIAVVCIALVHAVHFRSLGLALLSIVPTGISALAVVAFMHLTDRPLDIVNMVMVPLLLGIDTDYGILTVTAWQHAPTRAKLFRAFPASATAIVTCAGTTIVGFGSLALVAIPAIASLGWLITVGILACLAGTLFVLWPLMFLLARPERTRP